MVSKQWESRIWCSADCCDGSDEPPGVCKNTCAEAGAAARAELRQRADAEAAGAALKKAYLAQAQEAKALWAQEDAQLTKSIAQLQKLVDQWKSELPHCQSETPLERDQSRV